MKHSLLSAVTPAGVLIDSTTDAEAGPHPGLYEGLLERWCDAANKEVRPTDTDSKATNPTDPGAPFSTRIPCEGSFGRNDHLRIRLDVLSDGRGATAVSGEIPRSGKSPWSFSAMGKGRDVFTATSFSTMIENVTVNGKSASLYVRAGSSGKTLTFDVKIDGKSTRHPLVSCHTARFPGSRP